MWNFHQRSLWRIGSSEGSQGTMRHLFELPTETLGVHYFKPLNIRVLWESNKYLTLIKFCSFQWTKHFCTGCISTSIKKNHWMELKWIYISQFQKDRNLKLSIPTTSVPLFFFLLINFYFSFKTCFIISFVKFFCHLLG